MSDKTVTDAAPPDPRRRAIERFAQASASEPLIAAAFLGGSFASGTPDAYSDLDLYVVTEDAAYDEFFARREAFVRSWGVTVFIDTTVNFGGFGFDMVHFVLGDGVSGEVALGRRSSMLPMHGGAYEALVDKARVLDGVTFPLYEPSTKESRAAVQRALTWFWLDAITLPKSLARGRLYDAERFLASTRDRCSTLVEARRRADLDDGDRLRAQVRATFVPAEPGAIKQAAGVLIALHRDLGPRVADTLGLDHPTELATVVSAKIGDVIQLDG